jgi:hypothetical protein
MSIGGLSKARLARMHDVMAGHVARGQVPGLVTLVSRRGETHVDAVGMKAAGGREAMRRDRHRSRETHASARCSSNVPPRARADRRQRSRGDANGASRAERRAPGTYGPRAGPASRRA